MRWLELKIPPIAMVLALLTLMYLSNSFLPKQINSLIFQWMFLLLGILSGTILVGLGVKTFKQSETTVLPHCPEQSSALVTEGIYSYTRNPMYLGFALFLVGFSGFLGSFWLLFWVLFFVIYLTVFQIKPEEAILSNKFPENFLAYKQRVRRWI